MMDVPVGAPVLIYKTQYKTWEGPWRFIYIDGKAVIVQLERGRRIFRYTCVKLIVRSHLSQPNQVHHDQQITEAVTENETEEVFMSYIQDGK